MASKNKKLRSGYTTGACAAAAAKAATVLVMRNALSVMGSNLKNKNSLVTHYASHITQVEIPFPDGSRVKFKIQDSRFKIQDGHLTVTASVIKDAGDDPDVTNGAEIVAEVVMRNASCVMRNNIKKEFQEGFFNNSSRITGHASLIIKGGKGVGVVTKPGLPIPVGEAAINPVPRRMIKEAVMAAIKESLELRVMSYELKNKKNSQLRTPNSELQTLEVTISVTDGEKLAKKTLNHRLGIIGGISILGTTGIVKPISAEAWTATITSSMDVAKAMGRDEIVLSAGRSSEKAHMEKFNLSQESYVMMGDYLEFALIEAKKHGFKKIYLCAQWAKMLKIAMATPQTHVRHGAIDIKKALEFLKGLGAGDWGLVQEFNTAMEIFNFIASSYHSPIHPFTNVCVAAKKYAESIASGIPVISYLVSYEGKIIANSE